MKFWMNKKGDCGSMDDNGYVPDSEDITKAEYDEWVASIIISPEQIEVHRKTNIQAEIAKTYSLTDELQIVRRALVHLLPDSVDVQAWDTTVKAAKAKYPK